MNAYTRFAAMIATSTVVMFGLMYLNTYQLDHVFFSETRAYMALVMGATMAIIMLAYMMGMYKNQRVNIGIIGGSLAVFAMALWLVRKPSDGRRRVVHASHDSSSLHRDPDERTSAHHRSTRAKAGRPDHRDAAPRNRRDESADSRPREQVRLARVLAYQFRNRASGFLGCVLNVSIRLEPRMLVKTCAALATTKAWDDAASSLRGSARELGCSASSTI